MSRTCLPCTECCRGALEANYNGVDIGFNKPCEHVTDKGCGIGDNRPDDPCKSYLCSWVADEKLLPSELRPDLCKAILNRNRLTYLGEPVDELVPTGKTIPAETKEAFISLYNKKRSLLVIKETEYEEGIPYRTVVPVGPSFFRERVIKVAKLGHPLTSGDI